MYVYIYEYTGQVVLVTAAAGAAGTFAVQIAKQLGCEVVGAYMHVYMHICNMYKYIHIYIYIYMCTCIRVYMNVYLYTYTCMRP